MLIGAEERRLLWEYRSGETPQALFSEEARRNTHEPLASGVQINRQINRALKINQ